MTRVAPLIAFVFLSGCALMSDTVANPNPLPFEVVAEDGRAAGGGGAVSPLAR